MSSAPTRSRPGRQAAQALTFEHRPPLDGIRALAALLVIFFHAGTPVFDHGYVGVDVFFVLSGFLITSLLVRELLNTGRLNFVGFYARRARRLLPAALLVLIVTAVAYELVASEVAVAENRGGFVAAALYVSNWFFLAESQDYFAEDGPPSPVQHYWSLSVEEQFYLVWPAVVLGLVLLARRHRLRLDLVAAGLTLAGIVYAGVLASSSPMESYFGSPARAYQLLLGAAIALLVLRWEASAVDGILKARPSAHARVGGAVLAVGGLVLMLSAAGPWLETGSAYWHGVVSALGAGALILGLELAPRSAAGRSLSWGPARAVGRWSYAAYLWHWPVLVIGDEAGALPDAWLPRTLVVVALTLLLSAATFDLVERRAGRISLRTPPRRRLVAMSGIVTAVATALVCASVLKVDARAEAVIAQASAESSVDLVGVTTTDGGDGSTVLLIGDSHAAYLYPGLADLAEKENWMLVGALEKACPWTRVEATYDDGRPLECEQMRERALQVAGQARPDIALLVSRSLVRRPLRIGDDLIWPGEPGWLEAVEEGAGSFLEDLRPLVGRVVVIEPVPETARSMVNCLATDAAPASCAAPAVHRPGTTELEALWRGLPGVVSVSLDELLCPNGVCPAMVDGVVTHRDANHLTDRYMRLIADRLDATLRDQGVNLARGKVRLQEKRVR